MNQEQASLTESILTPEQVKNGFSAEEDDHCLYLVLNGGRVAVFSVISATAAAIREAADAIRASGIERERR
jgi:hypothetical protein